MRSEPRKINVACPRASPRESAIVAGIVRAAKKIGFWSMKIHGGPFQRAGVPDILLIRDGRAYWIEAKRPGCYPTPIQSSVMRELERAGSRCTVATCAGDAVKFLTEFL